MGLRGRSNFKDEGGTFFVTTTVMNFDKIFGLGDSYCDILLGSLKHVIAEHKAALFAYVFMPSHCHFVIAMPEGESISDLMKDFKKFTSTKVRQQLEIDNRRSLVERLRANSPRRKGQVFKLWMDRFDDVVIYSEDVLRIKIEYIHNNPVKAGLAEFPEQWKYSSARNYFLGDQSMIYVETDWRNF